MPVASSRRHAWRPSHVLGIFMHTRAGLKVGSKCLNNFMIPVELLVNLAAFTWEKSEVKGKEREGKGGRRSLTSSIAYHLLFIKRMKGVCLDVDEACDMSRDLKLEIYHLFDPSVTRSHECISLIKKLVL